MRFLKIKRCIICLLFLAGFLFKQNYNFGFAIQSVSLNKGQSVFFFKDQLQRSENIFCKDEKIASISNGIVTALSEGETLLKKLNTNSNKEEEIYKIKVNPPKLIKYFFTKPNNPKKGDTVELSVMTDDLVENVKFCVKSENSYIEKFSEEKLLDHKNFIYKIRLILKNKGDYKVFFEVNVKKEWKKISEGFNFTVFDTIPKIPTCRKASDKCVNYIMSKEGFKSEISADCFDKNIYDIGYGNVIKAGRPFYNNISKIEAKGLLLKRLNDGVYSRILNEFINENNLNFSQNQFDALLSFTYNLGVGWLKKSNLRNVILMTKNTNLKKHESGVKSIGTVISDNGLRLRNQPNTQSKILKVLKFKEKAEILSEDKFGWYKVRTKEGQEGYCFAEFLKKDFDYTKSNIAAVNSENGLRLRSLASTNSNIIKVLKPNEIVTVINKNYNNWYKVRTKEGQEGYCFADFLKEDNFNIEEENFKKIFIDEFLLYNKAKGRFVRGLLNRRIEELQIFFYNDYSCDGFKNKYKFPILNN